MAKLNYLFWLKNMSLFGKFSCLSSVFTVFIFHVSDHMLHVVRERSILGEVSNGDKGKNCLQEQSVMTQYRLIRKGRGNTCQEGTVNGY